MKITVFIFNLTFLFLFSFSALANSCDISMEEENQFMQMSYEDFDQSSEGWRQYATLNCYNEMGNLLDKYLEYNQIILDESQIINLNWHAGQMYAFNNEYNIAQEHFLNSINKSEPDDTPILWNAYVYATIAFLIKDMPNLLYQHNLIDNGPIFNGSKANLEVVDSLIENFHQPYSVAYHPNN